jgi:hypothetical protein
LDHHYCEVPLLAAYLEEDCKRVMPIIEGNKVENDDISDDIKKLFSDNDVISVIKGEKVGGPLDEDVIRSLITMNPGTAP